MAVERNTIELSQQEQEEVAKLFEEFASRDWHSQENTEGIQDNAHPEEVEDVLPEPTKKKLSKKQILIFCALGLSLLLAIYLVIAALIPSPLQFVAPPTISAGNHLVAAVTNDGAVLSPSSASSLGSYLMTTQTIDVTSWKDIVSVSVGTLHTLGLKSDGTVVCTNFITPDKVLPNFAENSFDKGQLNVSDWTNIVAVAAGYQHSVGLRDDGTVVAVGDNSYGQCEVSEWKEIIQIAAGQKHTVGLKRDGTVVSTKVPASEGDDGQCNTDSWTNITYIATGSLTTIGVRKDGTVVAAGANALGQCDVATWTEIVSVAAGEYQTVGLKKDGTVISTQIRFPLYTSFFPDYGQTKISHWTDIVAVAVTNQQTFGLKKDGTVIYAGLNSAQMNETKNWKNIQLP